MKRYVILALLIPCLAGPAFADGSVAVQVVAPQRGTAPTVVVAYGQAAPAAQSVRSLSLAQPGQVDAVMVTAGQSVKRGQPMVRVVTAPASVASYRQARSALTLAAAQRVHTQRLLSAQLATQDQMASADKALIDAQDQLAALSRDGAGRPSTTLAAPFDGVVASLSVAPGDRPAAAATLLTVAPASALQVSVGVEPGWRSQLRIGQFAQLEPLGGGPVITGRVIRIDSVLNPKTRLLDVDLATAAGAVLSGEAFRAKITIGGARGWLVPHSAVQVEAGQAFLFQVAGTKAARVNVAIVQVGRDTDVVTGPLDPRRSIVAVGGYQLDDGAAIRIVR